MTVKCERYNLQINQGADLRFTFRIKGVDSLPEDLTGRTFKGQIKASYNATDTLADFIITPKDQTSNKGEADVHLPNTALPQSLLNLSCRAVFVYDIEMTYLSGDKDRVLMGDAEVFPEVTSI